MDYGALGEAGAHEDALPPTDVASDVLDARDASDTSCTPDARDALTDAADALDSTVDAPPDAADAADAADVTDAVDVGACAPLPSGALAWWRGEDDVTDVIGHRTGTRAGAVLYTTGMSGRAFLFDGKSYASAPATGLPVGGAARTLELWARIDDPPTEEAFFAGYGGFGSYAATFHLGAEFDMRPFFSQWGVNTKAPFWAKQTWHHVAVTSTDAGLVRLYSDGVFASESSMPISTPSGTTFLIGAIPGDSSRRLFGAASEVTVYDRALTADEIRAIAAAGGRGKCLPP
jgi:hypothetical protein